VDARDFMPLHGIDHIELWVGNAAQAAYHLCHAFGFTAVAYAGLETGLRDRVSHVLQQGRIRLVLTGALRDGTEIGEHQRVHGDGVKRVALSVPSADAAYREAVARGATACASRSRWAMAMASCGSPRSPRTARPCTPSSSGATTPARSCPASLISPALAPSNLICPAPARAASVATSKTSAS